MSRIGKQPIKIADGVELNISGNTITVKGGKGSLTQKLSKDIKVKINKKEKVVTVLPVSDDTKLWNQWGLYRVLINNMVVGVSVGFKKILEIEGIGYKAEKKGKDLVVSAGYSHTVKITPPDGISIETESPTKIVVTGIDKQAVGQVAADIRSIRPPEPYKGKGIRYEGEHIIRKAGKTGAV